MAIDSRQKRFSIMSFGSSIQFVPMFEADATVDADDWYHLLNLYSGITLDAPITDVFVDNAFDEWIADGVKEWTVSNDSKEWVV